MTAADLAELRTQAEARAAVGCRASVLTLRLLDVLAAKDNLIRGLCDRVEAQSELLRKRAEK